MSNFLSFFLSVDPPSVLIYGILATLHSLSPSFPFLSISFSTMKLFQCQSFSLRGNKRACQLRIDCSLRQREYRHLLCWYHTLPLLTILFSLYVPLNLLIYPHLYRYIFHIIYFLSPPFPFAFSFFTWTAGGS